MDSIDNLINIVDKNKRCIKKILFETIKKKCGKNNNYNKIHILFMFFNLQLYKAKSIAEYNKERNDKIICGLQFFKKIFMYSIYNINLGTENKCMIKKIVKYLICIINYLSDKDNFANKDCSQIKDENEKLNKLVNKMIDYKLKNMLSCGKYSKINSHLGSKLDNDNLVTASPSEFFKFNDMDELSVFSNENVCKKNKYKVNNIYKYISSDESDKCPCNNKEHKLDINNNENCNECCSSSSYNCCKNKIDINRTYVNDTLNNTQINNFIKTLNSIKIIFDILDKNANMLMESINAYENDKIIGSTEVELFNKLIMMSYVKMRIICKNNIHNINIFDCSDRKYKLIDKIKIFEDECENKIIILFGMETVYLEYIPYNISIMDVKNVLNNNIKNISLILTILNINNDIILNYDSINEKLKNNWYDQQ